MKAESNIRPEPLSVERCAGDIAEVIFRENIEEVQKADETVFTYEEFRTAVPYRDNILEVVSEAKDAWLAKAKSDELAAAQQTPSLEEQVKQLQTENASLREENDTVGAALEEVISVLYGGN